MDGTAAPPEETARAHTRARWLFRLLDGRAGAPSGQ